MILAVTASSRRDALAARDDLARRRSDRYRIEGHPTSETAARRRSQQTRKRATKALHRLKRDSTPITVDADARAAGVSRSWLHANADRRDEIFAACAGEAGAGAHNPSVPAVIYRHHGRTPGDRWRTLGA
jgi:hypothetical protein